MCCICPLYKHKRQMSLRQSLTFGSTFFKQGCSSCLFTLQGKSIFAVQLAFVLITNRICIYIGIIVHPARKINRIFVAFSLLLIRFLSFIQFSWLYSLFFSRFCCFCYFFNLKDFSGTLRFSHFFLHSFSFTAFLPSFSPVLFFLFARCNFG